MNIWQGLKSKGISILFNDKVGEILIRWTIWWQPHRKKEFLQNWKSTFNIRHSQYSTYCTAKKLKYCELGMLIGDRTLFKALRSIRNSLYANRNGPQKDFDGDDENGNLPPDCSPVSSFYGSWPTRSEQLLRANCRNRSEPNRRLCCHANQLWNGFVLIFLGFIEGNDQDNSSMLEKK